MLVDHGILVVEGGVGNGRRRRAEKRGGEVVFGVTLDLLFVLCVLVGCDPYFCLNLVSLHFVQSAC